MKTVYKVNWWIKGINSGASSLSYDKDFATELYEMSKANSKYEYVTFKSFQVQLTFDITKAY